MKIHADLHHVSHHYENRKQQQQKRIAFASTVPMFFNTMLWYLKFEESVYDTLT